MRRSPIRQKGGLRRGLMATVTGALCVTQLFPGNTREVSLTAMVRLSGEVFVGTCLSVQPTQIPFQGRYLPVTRYLFRVTENLKGRPVAEHEILQLGWPTATPPSVSGTWRRLPLVIDGMPEYRVGEEYLLLMTTAGPLGLSSPVGLPFSVFQRVRDATRGTLWRGSVANPLLFDGLPTPPTEWGESAVYSDPVGGMAFGDQEFLNLVRKLVAGER